jgi:NADH dehydrogenase [ubiquinone] 1 alpha subcomplex assembly factor 7
MAKASPEISEDIASALKRLVGGGRSGMGTMFKVLGVSSPDISALPGLSDEQFPTP